MRSSFIGNAASCTFIHYPVFTWPRTCIETRCGCLIIPHLIRCWQVVEDTAPCEVWGQRPGRRTLGASVCTSPCCACSISLGLLPVMTSDEVPNWS
ncbi:hypothetical protein AGOR_G00113510 [Albula goreensis]|uniref:Uncharacterized protein n=1 Tax=Albula goreensis TaxID=1534307 RepID=A0A8T3DAB5_9TELE|nr:hypothetical protein AGOR_G00113510 [Albula goreensis]